MGCNIEKEKKWIEIRLKSNKLEQKYYHVA